MQQRLSRGELLDDLVAKGTLPRDVADDIESAPEWEVGIKELVTYLAALIIAVGVIRIVAVALEDASRSTVVVLLYVVAAALAFAAWKLSGRRALLDRFSEVCELGALLSLGSASGLLLSDTDLSPQSYISVIGAAAIGWGVWRSPHTRFAGVMSAIVGVPMFSAALGALIVDENPSVAGVLLLVASSGLVALGWTDVGSGFLARAAGCLQAVVASLMLSTHYQGAFLLLPVLVGVVLFGVGSVQLAPEMLLAGAFAVIVGTVVSVTEWVSNEMAQGLVIVAVGVIVLLVLGWQMKRRVSAKSPGAPAA